MIITAKVTAMPPRFYGILRQAIQLVDLCIHQAGQKQRLRVLFFIDP